MNDTTATIAKLTAKGRDTMQAVGAWQGSFFDDGCAEGSGIWAECFMNEMGHKSSGVINQLAKLGLFSRVDDETGVWFALTTLGVEVATALAGTAESAPESPEEAPAKPKATRTRKTAEEAAPGAVETTIKVCGKWTRFYQNGAEVGRVHNGAADAVFAVIRQG